MGVALPYSIASRLAKGGTFGKMFLHAAWRSLLLVALGIFLRSTGSPHTNFTFEDTLTQIGLGYTFLFLLGFRSPRWQWGALAVILTGYWLAWALYPAPELRLPGAGGARGLAAPLLRLRRPLEQERQPGAGLRRLVPQSLSAQPGRSWRTPAAT